MNPEHYKYMPHPKGEENEAFITEEKGTETLNDEENLQKEETVITEVVSEETETEKEAPAGSGLFPIAWLILKGLLQFIYDLFNPFLIPTYATLIVFETSILSITVPGLATPNIFIVLAATGIFPVLGILLLRYIDVIKDMALYRRKERLIPLILTFIGMGAVTLIFRYKGFPMWMTDIYIGATATILLNIILNFFIKVSNHSSAMAAALGIFFAIKADGLPHMGIGWWALGTILAAGIIGTISIIIGRHKLEDVLAGYATGFLPIILFELIR